MDDDSRGPREPLSAARAGGPQADRRGAHEPRDRRDPAPLREDRRVAPREHPAQARHARPRRARALRDPARARRAVSRTPAAPDARGAGDPDRRSPARPPARWMVAARASAWSLAAALVIAAAGRDRRRGDAGGSPFAGFAGAAPRSRRWTSGCATRTAGRAPERLPRPPVVVTFLYTTCEDTCPLDGAADPRRARRPRPTTSRSSRSASTRRTTRRERAQAVPRSSSGLAGRMRFLLGDRARARSRRGAAYGIRPQERRRSSTRAYVLLDRPRGASASASRSSKLTPEGLAHDIRRLQAEALSRGPALGGASCAGSPSPPSAQVAPSPRGPARTGRPTRMSDRAQVQQRRSNQWPACASEDHACARADSSHRPRLVKRDHDRQHPVLRAGRRRGRGRRRPARGRARA